MGSRRQGGMRRAGPEDRPALLSLDWATLIEGSERATLIEGSELELWSEEVRADLDRRVGAAYRRRDRPPSWQKPWLNKPQGGPQYYKPQDAA
jgi:hypothetical protein